MTTHVAEEAQIQLDLLSRVTAYWYACGYNDHRSADQPYVDPHAFAEYWQGLSLNASRPSVQDAFKEFAP